jgi:chemotaxis response regulator CheB
MADFPIVGIGSSAGGLEALQKLFGAMPRTAGSPPSSRRIWTRPRRAI